MPSSAMKGFERLYARLRRRLAKTKGEVKGRHLSEQGGFVLHGILNPPNEITAGLDILPAL